MTAGVDVFVWLLCLACGCVLWPQLGMCVWHELNLEWDMNARSFCCDLKIVLMTWSNHWLMAIQPVLILAGG
jgi:hypothetical protein